MERYRSRSPEPRRERTIRPRNNLRRTRSESSLHDLRHTPSPPIESTVASYRAYNPRKRRRMNSDAEGRNFYAQHLDPTLAHYIPPGQSIVMERAVRMMRSGRRVRGVPVRVRARPFEHTTMGQGLHEVLPTSERDRISNISSPELRDTMAQDQSGNRTTPAVQTMWDPEGRRIVGHTGTFVHPANRRSSQGTRGQSAAHDQLRAAHLEIIKRQDPPGVAAVNSLVAGLDNTPSGREMLQDPGLEAFTPNYTRASNSRELAAEIHNRREHMKDRVATLRAGLPESERNLARPTSPQRTLMGAEFGGDGRYAGRKRKRSPEPEFPDEYTIAHMTAWATQPMRLDPGEGDRASPAAFSSPNPRPDSEREGSVSPSPVWDPELNEFGKKEGRE